MKFGEQIERRASSPADVPEVDGESESVESPEKRPCFQAYTPPPIAAARTTRTTITMMMVPEELEL